MTEYRDLIYNIPSEMKEDVAKIYGIDIEELIKKLIDEVLDYKNDTIYLLRATISKNNNNVGVSIQRNSSYEPNF